MSKSIPVIDPQVAIFVTGTLAIVALAGISMGYGVDLTALAGTAKLIK